MEIKNKKAVSLIQLLVGSLILVIIISGSMLYIQNSFTITRRNARAFLAENIIREEFEKIRNNYPSRDSLYFNILKPLITGGSTFYIKEADNSVIPTIPAQYITSADWNGNTHEVIEAKSIEGQIVKYSLEFEVSEENIVEVISDPQSVLRIKIIVKWYDGDLVIESLTDY